jgi:AraC-like DNA-binding protein
MSGNMNDPLADVVSLLKPAPSISKLVSGGGRWIVERSNMGSPFYCAVVSGSCWITIAGRAPIRLNAGDFVLVPAIFDFSMSSLEPPTGLARPQPFEVSPGVFRMGDPDAPAEVQALVGHCAFASRDRELLLALLPQVIHVTGGERLTALVQMIHDETRADRPAREMVLGHLLELLLIEALRSSAAMTAPPGLLRGLADPQLALALRQIHAHPDDPHSVALLAKTAAMSRSTFYDRFRREMGAAPMEYVTSWRMALAKDMLATKVAPIAEVARRIGYGSASAFSVAFARHVGTPPGAFAGVNRQGIP